MYALARRVCQHARLASLITLSALLVPEVFHGAIGKWPHTVLMVVHGLATLLLILRLREEKTWQDYLLLGLCVGLGGLAKYNYAHFIAALAVAMLLLPRWRAILLDRRIVASLALAMLIVAPHGLWMVQNFDEVWHGVARYTIDKQSQFSGWHASVKHVSTNLVQSASRSGGFLLLPLALIFVPGWRTTKRDDGEVIPDFTPLLVRFYLAGAILLALIMIFGGVYHIRQHWLTSFAVLLPLLALSWFDPNKLMRWQWRAHQSLLVAVVLGAIVWRGGLITYYGGQGFLSSASYQYAAYASRLRAFDWNTRGVAVVEHPNTAGYLRLHFPRAQIHCLFFPLLAQPKIASDERVLISWHEPLDGINAKMRTYLKTHFGLDPAVGSETLIVSEPAGRMGGEHLLVLSVLAPLPTNGTHGNPVIPRLPR
jgi:4-amino-4-deoxy-L-arabinose transferase-like glycosyltransferase